MLMLVNFILQIFMPRREGVCRAILVWDMDLILYTKTLAISPLS